MKLARIYIVVFITSENWYFLWKSYLNEKCIDWPLFLFTDGGAAVTQSMSTMQYKHLVSYLS